MYQKITIGTRVRLAYPDALPGLNFDCFGEVVSLCEKRQTVVPDFFATVCWDNGALSFLNATFFRKTLLIVEESGS
ncbi:MAG: hypothetical protein Q7U98_18080 [Methylicorpusculum sp.]|uniref:hypothetical protein n=1 Tax=Methylicorpusculum sp. TaxID=2713644 RepID=UPI002719B47A|nr:hypothetical protein [Methylicorpusculum sp.]MDO8941066.1 hypothetical protein [Methylicorpusculum sp.]MDP2202335.1 hypothetical protein [Methylicorpusculum sp.]